MTGKELFEAMKSEYLPGFYLSLNGNICCTIGVYLISIFVNDITGELEITIDSCPFGYFEDNIEWVTVDTIKEAKQTIQDFVIWCYNKTAS